MNPAEKFRKALARLEKKRARLASIRPPRRPPRSRRVAAELGRMRGRPLFYDAVSTGCGNGAYLELLDGSVKIDFITGIGVHLFGHAHPALLEAAAGAALRDPMQGHLGADETLYEFERAILDHVAEISGLSHCFVSNSGAMANENALKILRQSDPRRTGIVAFEHCFHGRTQTMAELTDNPSIRVGLPVGSWRRYAPYYDPARGWTTERVIGRLERIFRAKKTLALVLELVQGEGGFRTAPPEFFVAVGRLCRRHKVRVWIDEVQTVGRTRSLFAFEAKELGPYADVVTAGKMLQCGVTLFRKELVPDPGLLSQTFAGATVPLAVGTRMISLLEKGRYFGLQGSIFRNGVYLRQRLSALARRCDRISGVDGFDGMIAFQVDDGSKDRTIRFIKQLFDNGLMTFYCGHGPYKVRLLPPMGVLNRNVIDEAMDVVERCVKG